MLLIMVISIFMKYSRKFSTSDAYILWDLSQSKIILPILRRLIYEGLTSCLIDRPDEHFISAAKKHVQYQIFEILRLDFKFEK